ncbi:hypothetical protein HK096_001466, partial [Nowakowskiella sp. JEL0078]
MYKLEEAASVTTPMETGRTLTIGEEKDILEMTGALVQELLGSLQFCATVSHPEISDALNLKFLIGRREEGLVNKKEESILPVCYLDASFQSCKKTSKSKTGYVIIMAGSPVRLEITLAKYNHIFY